MQSRTHNCGELRAQHAGEHVKLVGWMENVREVGGSLAFVVLRDFYGTTQIVIETSELLAQIKGYNKESTISVEGTVRERASKNPNQPTGDIEVVPEKIELLGRCRYNSLPFEINRSREADETQRLKYRYLDLRNPAVKKNIILRCNVIAALRKAMMEHDFLEITTPILTASSPEGARDYLVPARKHPGKFYALPQAPQQFKQLIQVAGFDRYFQIAPCFRDEDPRADRSPTDFYQLDIEMSFVTQEDVFAAVQPVLQGLFETFGKGRKVYSDWPRIAYRDALKWYGSDKPDLRNPIRMQDVSEHFRGSGFAIFAKLLEQEGNEVRAIPAPKGPSGEPVGRKFCDRMNAFAQQQGLPGMGYIFWRDAEDGSGMEAAGPLAKNIGPERTEAIRLQLGLEKGDAAFFLGGRPETFEGIAGKARNVIGEELGLTEKDCFRFAWIVDFPMYEKTDEGKIDFSHNPFSMPQGGLDALNGDPLEVYAYQYDLACNGYEVISGGIRNHKPEIMYKAFELAGYPASEVDNRFGGMVKAFRYGAPPHGGCAAGIDRLVMLLADTQNIREVIMFPMNQRAEDLLMGAPSEPTNEQLRELRLRVLPKEA